MRLIVDLDDELYSHIKNDNTYFLEDGEELYSIVKNATPIPDNATNGDMIKTVFPHYDIEIDEHKGYIRIFYEDFYTTYPLHWWNAPYKKGEE